MQLSNDQNIGQIRSFLAPKFGLLFSLILYKISVDIVYFTYMQAEWSTHFLTPFRLNFSPINFLLSYIILIAVSLVTPTSRNDFRFGFAIIYTVFFLVPVLTCFGLDYERSTYAVFLAVLGYLLTLLFSTLRLMKSTLSVNVDGEKAALAISFVFIALFFAISIATGAVNSFSLTLDDLYERRDILEQGVGSSAIAYISIWTQKIFTPFALAFSLIKRRWILFFSIFAIEIAFFGLTAHRVFLLYPFFVVGVIWAVRGKYGLSIIPPLMGGLILLVAIGHYAFDLPDAAAIIIRRSLFVPASVYFGWVEFFTNSDHVFWTDNILARFVPSEYSREPLPWYVGYYVSNGYEVGYNSGMIATGFAHAGLLGVALYSLIVGQIIKLVNSLIDNGVEVALVMAVLLPPLRTLIADSELSTALISHGLIIGVGLLFLSGCSSKVTQLPSFRVPQRS